jgi:HSP20 family protein
MPGSNHKFLPNSLLGFSPSDSLNLPTMFSSFLSDPFWDMPVVFRIPHHHQHVVAVDGNSDKKSEKQSTALANQSFFSHQLTNMRQPMVYVDVAKQGDQYLVHAEVPGMAKDDVQLHVDGRTLTISGHKKSVIEEGAPDTNFYRRETSSGSFSRSVLLPEDANIDELKASFDNGKLSINVPQLLAKRSPKQIEIQ